MRTPSHKTGLAPGPVAIPLNGKILEGEWAGPEHAPGVILFVHGSGSSRRSPRNRAVAASLQEAGLQTLLFDLLTAQEETEDARTGHLRFDVELLAHRLVATTRWVICQPHAQHLSLGYFGASTGAAAALIAAAELHGIIDAVVSRGGRPDLARHILPAVVSPTLLIVGERDDVVLQLNREALARMRCERQLATVPDATHLFEEPGALDCVARLTADWFLRHM